MIPVENFNDRQASRQGRDEFSVFLQVTFPDSAFALTASDVDAMNCLIADEKPSGSSTGER
jgi:hypothetical protein